MSHCELADLASSTGHSILFVLMLYIPVNNFSVMPGKCPVFLGRTSTKQRIKCLAQEHNTMRPVSLEPVAFQSQL